MKDRIRSTQLLDNQIALFYTGQMGFLIQAGGRYLLLDGYLSDYVDRHCSGERGVQWKRRYPAPIAPQELDFLDFVLCTHAHEDHTDPETLAGIASVNRKARFLAPARAAAVMADCGVPRERITVVKTDAYLPLCEGIGVTAIPAAHETLHPDGQGGYDEVGYRLDLGGITLYHSGDCCPYDGLEERLGRCDICILPINGRDYYRTRVQNIIGNFDAAEALTLARSVGAKLLIPGHFDLYDVNGANPAGFVDCLYRLRGPRPAVHLFAPGERYIYEA